MAPAGCPSAARRGWRLRRPGREIPQPRKGVCQPRQLSKHSLPPDFPAALLGWASGPCWLGYQTPHSNSSRPVRVYHRLQFPPSARPRHQAAPAAAGLQQHHLVRGMMAPARACPEPRRVAFPQVSCPQSLCHGAGGVCGCGGDPTATRGMWGAERSCVVCTQRPPTEPTSVPWPALLLEPKPKPPVSPGPRSVHSTHHTRERVRYAGQGNVTRPPSSQERTGVSGGLTGRAGLGGW